MESNNDYHVGSLVAYFPEKHSNPEYSIMWWGDYIKLLDLGIEYYGSSIGNSYRIIDRKKWMLTKIKYGIM